ncbi:MAG: hypothetical protein V4724_31810 [Pseudomonadota bacterium]
MTDISGHGWGNMQRWKSKKWPSTPISKRIPTRQACFKLPAGEKSIVLLSRKLILHACIENRFRHYSRSGENFSEASA